MLVGSKAPKVGRPTAGLVEASVVGMLEPANPDGAAFELVSSELIELLDESSVAGSFVGFADVVRSAAWFSQAKVTGVADGASTTGVVETGSISLRESRCAKATAIATKRSDKPEPVNHIVHLFMTKTSLSTGQNVTCNRIACNRIYLFPTPS